MRLRKSNQPEPDVSMSPLIDCVFLLLIFFLVATMYKKEDRDIDILLPDSSSSVKMPPDDDQIVLGITLDGETYWQGTEISRTDLHARLQGIGIEDPDKRIRLDADLETPFELVVELLDVCQFRGLTNVGIRTYDDRYNTR